MSTGKEGQKKDHSFRDFSGINTQSSRTTIEDNEFAWIENVIPIGHGNLVAVPNVSAVLATWSPSIAYLQQSENLNNVDYDYVLTTDGAGYQVNLTNYSVTKFAPGATFSASGATITQWENIQIVIVDPVKGYFSWNGTTLTNWNGIVQTLTITAIGTGYTSSPTITLSAPVSGTTATATSGIQLGLATLSAAGTGYAVNDVLTISGGTQTVRATLTVSAVNASTGAITGFNITTTGNYTASPANPASVNGGYGSGATFTLNFGIGPLVITNAGTGYGNTPPTVTVSGGGGSNGAITATLSVVPSTGSAIAAYSNRIWVASGRTIIFSAPGSFSDFSSIDAGGSFIISDEALHSSVQSLISANNFLYIFGVSSVNVLSGVSVVSGSTIFTNTNVAADIGSTSPDSLIAYNRAVWFATPYGIQALYGATTQKTSDKLDGIFQALNGTQNISSGVCLINELRVLCFLVQYIDPVAGLRSLLVCYYDKKWFLASQGNNLTYITTAYIGGVPTLFGTDGKNLYQLFSNKTASITQTIKTKLWDMGAALREKQILKFGFEHIDPSIPIAVTGTIDTEVIQNSASFSFASSNAIAWTNASNVTVTWTNASSQVITWIGSGYSFNATDIETNGFFLGMTMTGMSAGEIYQGFHMQYELRAAWPGH
jgi:hypothetical protein